MEVPEIKIDQNKGIPEVDIMIGQAQFGKYVLEIGDSQFNQVEEVRIGNNMDQIADKFPINIQIPSITTSADVVDRVLGWDTTVAAPDQGPNQLYYVRIIVSQDGTPVENGLFEFQGMFEKVESILGIARFV